jgi:hypothetical protein
MPCYLFTFHAYRSWMPDHRRGFTRRKEGIVPQNEKLAKAYKKAAKAKKVAFSESMQRALINEVQVNAGKQEVRSHFVATDSTHVHVLVSWKEFRPWHKVRSSIKSSLTRRLNREFCRRTWLSENGSRKRVENREHFNYLVGKYLRAHRGWKWSETEGLFK